MTPDLKTLSRRAVACPRWRWMPGMRWVDGEESGRLDDWQPEGMARPHGALPDLSDAATVGCLLALVRKAWPAEPAVTDWESRCPVGDRVWRCSYHAGYDWQVAYGSTEAEALVKALEAAP